MPYQSLSEEALETGISPMSYGDFLKNISVFQEVENPPILVGGLALAVYGQALGIKPPEVASKSHIGHLSGPGLSSYEDVITIDIDFLGSQDDAQRMRKHAGITECEIYVPNGQDSTINSAVIFQRNEAGKVALIDFISSVTGLSNTSIIQNALLVDLFREDGQPFHLRVMHPLDCLESRVANVTCYESKRRKNGIEQCLWSIAITKAFFHQLIQSNADPKKLRKYAGRILELAEYKSKFAYQKCGIDILQVLDDQIISACGESFKNQQWPVFQRRILGKQENWKLRAAA